jgi:hypothetical protein
MLAAKLISNPLKELKEKLFLTRRSHFFWAFQQV